MSQPAYKSDMTGDARAHLLGAISSAYAAHDELMKDNRISALIEIDRTIALAHEARKFLLTPTGQRSPAAEVPPQEKELPLEEKPS